MDSRVISISASLSETNSGITGWAYDNVYKPIANTAVIEPHNALTSSINDIASTLGRQTPLLKDWELYNPPKAGLFTKEWLAQNVSSGVAMVIPYGIAALGTKGALRYVGAKFECEGLAHVLKAKETSMILGAGIYDFMRKPKQNEQEHETRLGNSLGGMAAFAVFAGGNHRYRNLEGWRLVRAQMGVGAVGAFTQQLVSHGVSEQKLPSAEQMLNAVASGATMNVLLPRINDKVSEVFTEGQLKRGKSVLIDDFVERELSKIEKQTGHKPESPTLNELMDKSPWHKVAGGPENKAIHGTTAVSAESLPKLAHELVHSTGDMRFEAAREALAAGRVDEARVLFTEQRLSQETAARHAEAKVASELGLKHEPQLHNISEQLARPGQTYGQLWAAEFEAFRASAGRDTPQVSYSGTRQIPTTPAEWQTAQRELAAMSEADKVNLARNLRHAPDSQCGQLWSKLAGDKSQPVRLAAIDALAQLPPQRRLAAWYEAVGHTDYTTRAAAIGKIGELPASKRFEAWNHALSNAKVLQPDKGRSPSPSELSPEALLVDQIQNLPSGSKLTAWKRAYENPSTRAAAVGNLSVVPEMVRSSMWSKAWNEQVNRTRYGQKGGELESLAKQVGELPAADRPAAWKQILDCEYDLKGETVARALRSLPEEVRLTEWRKLLHSLSEREARQLKDPYEGDKGVTSAIQALPESQRMLALAEAIKTLPESKLGLVSKEVASLPVADRGTAFCHLLERSQGRATLELLPHIPAEAIPQVLRIAARLPEGSWRGELANRLPLANTGALELPQVQRLMVEIFQVASETKLLDSQTMRNLWRAVPEGEPPASYAGREPKPVREHLAEQLPAADLARLLFDDPAMVRAMSDKPGVVRGLAALCDGQPETCKWVQDVTQKALSTPPEKFGELADSAFEKCSEGVDAAVAADLFAVLVKKGGPEAHRAALTRMASIIGDTTGSADRACLALEFASRLRGQQPTVFEQTVLQATEAAISGPADYLWRLSVARQLSNLSRTGYLGDTRISLPSLRLPDFELERQQQERLRGDAESALRAPSKIAQMMGDGVLGRVFPLIFGHDHEGGIVGRPQTGVHQFPVDIHSLKALQGVLDHPDFALLSPKDQTNLLWATLLHDAGKRRAQYDPGHEWASGNLAWGVLGTLGYPPARIQRIASLISRHSEMSFAPDRPTLRTPAEITDLAVAYRHPAALLQLKILNESDIRALNSSGNLLTPEAKKVIASNTDAVAARQGSLALPFPVLTTELPRRFGLVTMEGDWAVLAHTSPFIESAFLTQRGLIESPSYSISTSLLTKGQLNLSRQVDIVALVTGAPEAISRAGRQNLSTGQMVDWQGHVRQTATPHPHMQMIATEVVGGNGTATNSRWQALWERLGKYDTLTELQASGDQSAVLAHARLLEALTSEPGPAKTRVPLTSHNEVKVNNATVTGFGIMRRGRPVVFEGMDAAARTALLGGQKAPAWLVTEPTPGSVVIPRSIWQDAMRLRLPIVLLD